MKNLGYYNGKWGPLEEMMIPMNDRVCWFGDGVYDAGPARNHRIFALDDHVDRFFRSAELIDIEMPVSKEELKDILNMLLKEMDQDENFVFYQVSRGTAIREHTYDKGPGNLWVMIRPGKISEGLEPMKLISLEDTRFLHCNVKTLNLIPSVMASQQAMLSGADEAIFFRPGERVTECAHSNVSMLKDGVLKTAPTDNLILPGIARAHLIAACRSMDIPVLEEAFTLEELFDADEIIITSSSNPCGHADQIDEKEVGGRDPELLERIRTEVLREFYEMTEA